MPRERAEVLLGSRRRGHVQWLGTADLELRMRLLLDDHAAVRLAGDRGRFSLAGAQPKTALILDAAAARWGVPSGATPTTHILKPATGRFDGFAENEHFCAQLARSLGMPAASSVVRRVGGISVFVTERYDRLRRGRRVVRVHQEDLCQALARMPQDKYQNEGGPSAAEVVGILRAYSSARAEDVGRFVDALLFHWLVVGTDAHAKNYSLLLGGGGDVRLAPLYDLASVLPYGKQVPLQRAALAMKVGGEYRVRAIGARQWRRAADELRVDPADLAARMATMAAAVPAAAVAVRKAMRGDGVDHPAIGRLVAALEPRAAAAAAIAAGIA